MEFKMLENPNDSLIIDNIKFDQNHNNFKVIFENKLEKKKILTSIKHYSYFHNYMVVEENHKYISFCLNKKESFISVLKLLIPCLFKYVISFVKFIFWNQSEDNIYGLKIELFFLNSNNHFNFLNDLFKNVGSNVKNIEKINKNIKIMFQCKEDETESNLTDIVNNNLYENSSIKEFYKNGLNNLIKNLESKQVDNIHQHINFLVNKIFDNIHIEKKLENSKIIIKIIEKFIYSNLNQDIIVFYDEKYLNKNNQLNNKKNILKGLDNKKVLIDLEIKEKFKLSNEVIPYKESINKLNILNSISNPNDKLKLLIEAENNIKKSIFEYHNSNIEIQSQDDEFPIKVYIIAMCEIENLYSNFEYLNEYISTKMDYDRENKVLTYFQSACDYISIHWNLDEINNINLI